MRLFVAKRPILLMSEPPLIIHRGAMYAVESEEDLPDFNFMYGEELDPSTACLEDWEELSMVFGDRP
jgi:hypothetical protein